MASKNFQDRSRGTRTLALLRKEGVRVKVNNREDMCADTSSALVHAFINFIQTTEPK